ncbi:MAG: CHAD domain-containing protein [Thermomicrobiales bacterium]
MAYRLEPDEALDVGVRRIATEQVEKALAELDDSDLDRHATVHQVRKRCKKIRGLLRLVRPGLENYSDKNQSFRDAARRLSPIRDGDAILETYDELTEIYGDLVDLRRFRTIRTTLEHRRDAVNEELSIDERLDEFREFCVEQLDDITGWSIDAGEGGIRPILGGLRKTYGRGYDDFRIAVDEGSAEDFHEWRKRVKYHWYHLRILRDVWPSVVRARRDELDRLSDLLGDEHDLAVLSAQVEAEPHSFAGCRTIQALLGLVQQRRQELQAKARRSGRRVYAEAPNAFAARFEIYLEVWEQSPVRGNLAS